MVCKSTWPNWKGDDKSATQEILSKLNIDSEEYRLGKTKVFIRNPTTVFLLEEKREEAMPRVVALMQAAYRGFVTRSQWGERKAAIRIQLFFKKHKFRKYFVALRNTFQNVRSDKNWGKNYQWPPHPPILSNGVALLRRVHACWRAKMMITSLTAEQQAHMRQKVLAYDIFKGKKPWNAPRKFDGDYLELDTNPHKDAYRQAMTLLFSTYGDTAVTFADYTNKVNKVGKSQKRGIVVTEKNIYKHDPKNYKVKKFGTPIVAMKKISLSHQRDSFVVIHCNPPEYRDLILDLGIEGHEKYSEMVSVLVQEFKKLTGENLPVEFADRITYNNSRTPEKPGKEETLTFVQDAKVKVRSEFKAGKNGANTILYL